MGREGRDKALAWSARLAPFAIAVTIAFFAIVCCALPSAAQLATSARLTHNDAIQDAAATARGWADTVSEAPLERWMDSILGTCHLWVPAR